MTVTLSTTTIVRMPPWPQRLTALAGLASSPYGLLVARTGYWWPARATGGPHGLQGVARRMSPAGAEAVKPARPTLQPPTPLPCMPRQHEAAPRGAHPAHPLAPAGPDTLNTQHPHPTAPPPKSLWIEAVRGKGNLQAVTIIGHGVSSTPRHWISPSLRRRPPRAAGAGRPPAWARMGAGARGVADCADREDRPG